jgi:hypothetical protein
LIVTSFGLSQHACIIIPKKGRVAGLTVLREGSVMNDLETLYERHIKPLSVVEQLLLIGRIAAGAAQ